jgi:hypothetical protein
VPIAATPAASAAFFATRLTFGRTLFFVALAAFVLVVLLGFDFVRARVDEDLALVRLTLFFMVHFLDADDLCGISSIEHVTHAVNLGKMLHSAVLDVTNGILGHCPPAVCTIRDSGRKEPANENPARALLKLKWRGLGNSSVGCLPKFMGLHRENTRQRPGVPHPNCRALPDLSGFC